MRTISPTSRFRKDLKRELRGPYRGSLIALLEQALDFLRADVPLPFHYRDHSLGGNWIDHRDCHLRPDLVLIYRKPNPITLQLVRLGTHSELGL